MLRADAVSRVVNQLRLITKDDYFPRRTILRMLEDKAVFFLSQKLNDKSLFRENNLYSTLRCFELEPVDMVKCDIIEFRRCSTLMKSKEKLPRPIFSKYGDSILSVANLDNSLIFNQKPLRDYINSKKRKNANILQYNYYIQDDYLYIPDVEVHSLEIQILTLRTEEIESKSGCSYKDKCKSAYDYEFIMSDKIAEVIIQETIKEAVGTFKQIPIDENPNLNSNEK